MAIHYAPLIHKVVQLDGYCTSMYVLSAQVLGDSPKPDQALVFVGAWLFALDLHQFQQHGWPAGLARALLYVLQGQLLHHHLAGRQANGQAVWEMAELCCIGLPQNPFGHTHTHTGAKWGTPVLKRTPTCLVARMQQQPCRSKLEASNMACLAS